MWQGGYERSIRVEGFILGRGAVRHGAGRAAEPLVSLRPQTEANNGHSTVIFRGGPFAAWLSLFCLECNLGLWGDKICFSLDMLHF